MTLRFGYVLFALLTIGCSSHYRPPTSSQLIRPAPQLAMLRSPAKNSAPASLPPSPASALDPQRQTVLSTVKRFMSGAPLQVDAYQFDSNPVGFVRAAFWSVPIELFNPDLTKRSDVDGMQVLYRSAALRKVLHYKTPQPGDLVFFDHNTRKGQLFPTQVAIVEHVATDGTVTAAGVFANGPTRVKMNLRYPKQTQAADGQVQNDVITLDTPVPLAQLFRAFANPY